MSESTNRKFTLEELAQSGYIMGLATIGEVASHIELHYDGYFSIEDFGRDWAAFETLIAGHTDDPIEMYVSDEVKRKIDEEMEEVFRSLPDDAPEDDAMT